jgi:hypothetical protein
MGVPVHVFIPKHWTDKHLGSKCSGNMCVGGGDSDFLLSWEDVNFLMLLKQSWPVLKYCSRSTNVFIIFAIIRIMRSSIVCTLHQILLG